jgi:hypothetical protein
MKNQGSPLFGIMFFGTPALVMLFAGIMNFGEWIGYVCAALCILCVLLLLAGLFPSSERLIEESSEIESIEIALISRHQHGDELAGRLISHLHKAVEHDNSYGQNSGIRKWKKDGNSGITKDALTSGYYSEGLLEEIEKYSNV